MSNSNLEKAATSILCRAVELDEKHRFTEALVCYQEGLQLLVNFLKTEGNAQKKSAVRGKIESYMQRAEKLKKHIETQKDAGSFHEQVVIDNDSRGHSYKSVFGRFLDADVTGVRVEDPYIRTFHQCQNFLRLCELLLQSCNNLKSIVLVTSSPLQVNEHTNQMKWLQDIRTSLLKENVELVVQLSPTLHDRQIRLDNGWIIKIGRGLDYFKPPENKFAVGNFELDFRYCYQTTVDIYHSKK
ncbi:MIT domain-containing protein 1-like [Schistocerca americana]|nr:MIT domain-containing protein 1-like [Schistocerca americana]XP_047003136.1 MIT domain-containing protein 1-like [Schistocerca americana]XP_047003138.1 MIT domain-containing protein 1-like [Schistocerca americana]XP_047003139.1 MIT domain-containing protein 1-like [Schistocerca americana]XP_047003140.1 MIT domain-containing protein 1-like [Schistocerca americana]XP_047003141.1 MIT domain-containing protein 1-like [Schistocerca americana]XP_047003142.1 MIT domain-containing protein 1-like [